VNFQRKWIILLGLLGAISIFIILVNGCKYITPEYDYDYDSYTVSKIRVSPSSATMKVNTSKFFKVWAYDSEDNLIPVDPSEVDWIATYECWVCGKVWKFNPNSGSISTYFTPERTGNYFVFAHYKEKWGYSSVEVE